MLSAKDLRALLDDTLLVRHISVRLATFDADDSADAVRATMQADNFDSAAIRSGGVILGYILRDRLSGGLCKDHLITFGRSDIVSSNTPLVEVLPFLADRKFLFVLNRIEIKEIVTLSDLQKSPVRMALFGTVTLLEMYMLWMVRICYPDDAFTKILPVKRLDLAHKLLAIRKHKNEEIDLADCLQMCDKRDLLLKVPHFVEHFELESEGEAKRFFEESEDLRNNLAHAQDITAKDTSWTDVAALCSRMGAFLRQVEDGAPDLMRLFQGKGNVARD